MNASCQADKQAIFKYFNSISFSSVKYPKNYKSSVDIFLFDFEQITV